MSLKFDPDSHTYRWHGAVAPSVTHLLKPLGGYEWVDAEVLERKAGIGRAVHLATHLDDLGSLDESSVAPEVEPYLAAWRRFRQEVPCEWLEIETATYSPRGYAGTPDRVGFVRGAAAIVDIKTTAVINVVTGVQLAAYARLVDLAPDMHRYAVQLKDSGNYVLHEFRSPDDWPCFNALLAIHHWKGKHK